MSQVPVPSRRRDPGPPSRPIGSWVLGEELFPRNGLDQRWRGYIRANESTITTTYAQVDATASTTFAEDELQ